ncbi:ficolin-3-like [Clytia hemisphaerica]
MMKTQEMFVACVLLFETQLVHIAAVRYELVVENLAPSKLPFSSTHVKFEQHCISKCHYMIKCASFLIEPTSNINPIKCSFYNTTTTKVTGDFQTSTGSKLFTDIRDCQDVYDRGSKASGFYSVNLLGKGERDVFCNMDFQGGGWMAFTYRIHGGGWWDTKFDKYKNGFGRAPEDYYLGNENLHQLTKSGEYELYYLTDARDTPTTYHGWYGQFSVSDEADFYRLSIGDFREGTDVFFTGNGKQFTAKDVDKDGNNDRNCASMKKGGFWYVNCGRVYPHSKFGNLHKPALCIGLQPAQDGLKVCCKNFQIFLRRNF